MVVLLCSLAACGTERWAFDVGEVSDDAAVDTGPVEASASFVSDSPFFVDDSAVEAEAGFDGSSQPEAAPPCMSTSDCPFDQPVCTPQTGLCSPCTGVNDCASAQGGPACDLSSGACVPCVSNQDCSGRAGLTHCYVAKHACVACLVQSDCPRESYCELASHSCSPSI